MIAKCIPCKIVSIKAASYANYVTDSVATLNSTFKARLKQLEEKSSTFGQSAIGKHY